ncbi:hypothetical protein Plec18170_004639 [Paecilomyces lecythidis]
MLATDPPEFIIRVHDGFTRDLWKHASITSAEHEKKKLRCSIDGGYGQVLDFKQFDRVVLVAGGSGASFTFAVAMDLIRKESGVKSIDFIWAVRSKDALAWYDNELRQLQPDPRVNLRVYVTRSAMAMEETTEIATPSSPDVSDSDPITPTADVTVYDIEKGSAPETTKEKLPFPINLHQGRPQISDLLADIVSKTDAKDCIAVGACGPSDLIDRTRDAVRKGAYDNGPSITLYSEEFRW